MHGGIILSIIGFNANHIRVLRGHGKIAVKMYSSIYSALHT